MLVKVENISLVVARVEDVWLLLLVVVVVVVFVSDCCSSSPPDEAMKRKMTSAAMTCFPERFGKSSLFLL